MGWKDDFRGAGAVFFMRNLFSRLDDAVTDHDQGAFRSDVSPPLRDRFDFDGVPADVVDATEEDLRTAWLFAKASEWGHAQEHLDKARARW